MARRKHNPWEEQFLLSFDFPREGSGSAPTALITCETNANMADTDYITIPDGFNAPVLYEYDKGADGVTAGRASWAAGASTAADVAATLKTAIEANQPLITVTDNLDGTLTLAHKIKGVSAGTITENVANAGFLVSGWTGSVPVGEIAATTTIKLLKAKRRMRVDGVQFILPAGFAGHGSNYWELALKKGSTVMAQWSTDSDVSGQGTVTADTATEMVLSATAANQVAQVDDVLALVLTKAASAANLSTGRIVIRGRYE